MEDPRDAITKLYDTIDELIVALVELKKILEPMMDVLNAPVNRDTKWR